jgi:hypothetical protein
LREQRNVTDFNGELVTEALVEECLEQAVALLDIAQKRLQWVEVRKFS